jgi:hypothetical protein
MTQHKLITAKDRKALEANWKRSEVANRADAGVTRVAGTYSALKEKPVIKLFDPWGQAFWLLVELEPGTSDDYAFGLADLGLGFPEIGYVSVGELKAHTWGPDGPPRIERDLWFQADKTLAEYLTDAKEGIRP